jgi:hypothetical protein
MERNFVNNWRYGGGGVGASPGTVVTVGTDEVHILTQPPPHYCSFSRETNQRTHFHPTDGGSIYIRNIRSIARNYSLQQRKNRININMSPSWKPQISNTNMFFYYWWGGTKSLGTAATSGLLYKPQMIDEDDCGVIGGVKIGRGNRSTRRKPAPAPLCPPQIPHDQTRARTPSRRSGKPATNYKYLNMHLFLVWMVSLF